jgi:hypothetical protein
MNSNGSFRILCDTCKTSLTDEARRLSKEHGCIEFRLWAVFRDKLFTRLCKEGHGYDSISDAMKLASEDVLREWTFLGI